MLLVLKNLPEAEERQRTFVLDTRLHKIMEIMCFSSDVHQCNITDIVVRVQLCFQMFLILYLLRASSNINRDGLPVVNPYHFASRFAAWLVGYG